MIKQFAGLLCALSAMLLWCAQPGFAVLPNIFATQSSGNVAASLLDQNFTFLETQGVQGLTTTGSANTYIATPADAWLTGYSSYVARALTIIPSATNTGASTINVSGLGTVSIYKNVSGVATALASGDIVANVPAVVVCDGSGFLLVNPTSSSGTSYTTGTWTASFVPAGGSITINPSFNTGRYFRVGDMVCVMGQFVVSSVSSPVGVLLVSGLPVTIGSSGNGASISVEGSSLSSGATTALQALANPGEPYIDIFLFSAGMQWNAASSVLASSFFYLSGCYSAI
jgi:hypothetical protein